MPWARGMPGCEPCECEAPLDCAALITDPEAHPLFFSWSQDPRRDNHLGSFEYFPIASDAPFTFVPSGSFDFRVFREGHSAIPELENLLTWEGPYWVTDCIELTYPAYGGDVTAYVRAYYVCEGPFGPGGEEPNWPLLALAFWDELHGPEASEDDCDEVPAQCYGQTGINVAGCTVFVRRCLLPWKDIFLGESLGQVDYWTVREIGATPENTATFNVTVYHGGCAEDGTPAAGLTVELRDADGDAIDSAVTNGSGQCTLSTNQDAPCTVYVQDGSGCSDSAGFALDLCGQDQSFPVVLLLCCTSVTLEVLDDADDSPIEGAVVTMGVLTAETDGDGLATLDLDASILEQAEEGEDCSERILPRITVTKVDPEADPPLVYLDRCIDGLEVGCGTGPDPIEVRMAEIPEGYLVHEGDPPCCEDEGCTVTGPPGRALFPTVLDFSLDMLWRTNLGLTIFEFGLTGQLGLVFGSYPGETVYQGCFNFDEPLVLPNACEVEPDVYDNEEWHSARLTLRTCLEGDASAELEVRLYRAPDCGEVAGSEGLCPACETDLVYTIAMDQGAAEGAATRRICYGDGFSISYEDTTPISCDVLTDFTAAGVGA